MDTTGFSRVEIQPEPKWIAERWSQIPSASAAWSFNFSIQLCFSSKNKPKLKLHAAEAGSIQREFVTG